MILGGVPPTQDVAQPGHLAPRSKSNSLPSVWIFKTHKSSAATRGNRRDPPKRIQNFRMSKKCLYKKSWSGRISASTRRFI